MIFVFKISRDTFYYAILTYIRYSNINQQLNHTAFADVIVWLIDELLNPADTEVELSNLYVICLI